MILWRILLKLKVLIMVLIGFSMSSVSAYTVTMKNDGCWAEKLQINGHGLRNG